MALEQDHGDESAEVISCFCIKCGTKCGGSLRNSWLQISKSYISPLEGELNGHDGMRQSAKAKVGAKSTELEGW